MTECACVSSVFTSCMQTSPTRDWTGDLRRTAQVFCKVEMYVCAYRVGVCRCVHTVHVCA